MIKFIKPVNLNGAELLAELNAANVEVVGGLEGIRLENQDLFLDVNDEIAASIVVLAHNGTSIASEPTVVEKLARAGLSLDELKEALGL